MRAITLTAFLAACEHVDELVPAPTIVAPEAPPLEAIESSITAREPPPPKAAPIRPDMINIPARLQRWFASLDGEQRVAVRHVCRMRRDNPCWGLLRPPGAEDSALLASIREIDERVDVFCHHVNRGSRGCNTPLVVAFGGEPITFTPANGLAFAFGGARVVTDWPAASTPWIALDRDGDGAITNSAELFGNSATTRNGFEALAALDDNRDGVIDGQDAAFTRLLLWADANGDRASTPAELRLLASVITRIPLAHTVDARCTNGNCEGERSAVEWRDASGTARTGAVVDVYLRTR